MIEKPGKPNNVAATPPAPPPPPVVAWEVVLREHNGVINGTLRRSGVRPQDLEDATQDVHLRLFVNYEKIREPFALRIHAYWHAKDVAKRYRRHYRRFVCVDDAILADWGGVADENANLDLKTELLNEQVLDEREISVMHCRFEQGLSVAQTAAILEMSVAAVKAVQARAVAKLRMVWFVKNERKPMGVATCSNGFSTAAVA